MKRETAASLLIVLLFVSLGSTFQNAISHSVLRSIAAPVQAQTQFTVWTDKPVYSVGETVQIHVRPTPAFGVKYWLIIWKPDGSQVKLDLSPGQDTSTITADQAGHYQVELWAQLVYTGTTPGIAATSTFDVQAGGLPDLTVYGLRMSPQGLLILLATG